MYAEGDKVTVIKSKCGYAGSGTIVCLAYGIFYLIKIDDEKPRLILVRAIDMKHQRK